MAHDPSGSDAAASLDQFRQVLEDQRRQTAQLQSLLESRLGAETASGAAAGKVETLVAKIESLASRLDSIGNGGNGHAGVEKATLPPQVNGLMLRVGELERKISEATPEPLLKEIVFRLGSLEDAVGQSPDGGGIGEIRERVKALERHKAQPALPDPRVDELARRLAAFESAPRDKADGRIDEALARLDSLEGRAAAGVATAEVEELKQQLDALRAEVQQGNENGLQQFELRLAAIESKPAEAAAGDDPAPWEPRLEAVESWNARLAALEEKAAASSPRIEVISARIEKLDSLDLIAGRLGKVEEQASAPARDPRVDEIQTRVTSLESLPGRLEALETKPAEPAADPRFDGLEARLDSLGELAQRIGALELKSSAAPADPRVDEINARLGAMADVAHIGDVESRVSSLTTRLDALKMITDGLKATHKQNGGDSGGRMDALRSQVEELKALVTAHGEAAVAAQPAAWDDLRTRIETLEKVGPPTAHDPRFTELAARLASIEKSGTAVADPRVTEILARLSTMEQPNSAQGAAVPSELMARIDALEKRLAGASASGADPIVAQLRERWDMLEERVLRIEENVPETGDGQIADELPAQVAELRAKLDALNLGDATPGLDPDTVATLRELATKSASATGGLDLKTVKSQMTFVYFSIGMLYAICAYAGYVMLSSH